MTPRARTTLVVGVAAVAVIAGLAVAAWPGVMERYWAGRFADEGLTYEERFEAARQLVASESLLLVETAMNVLPEHPEELDNDQASAVRQILLEALHPVPEAFAEVSVASLRQAYREGEEREKAWAITLLMPFHRFSLEATPEFIAGMQSGNEELQKVSAAALVFGLADWRRSESPERPPVEAAEFAYLFGASPAELNTSLAAIARSPSFEVRVQVLAILSEHLVPSPELEAMLPPDMGELVKRRRNPSRAKRTLVDMELQLLHLRKERAGEHGEGLMPLGDVEKLRSRRDFEDATP